MYDSETDVASHTLTLCLVEAIRTLTICACVAGIDTSQRGSTEDEDGDMIVKPVENIGARPPTRRGRPDPPRRVHQQQQGYQEGAAVDGGDTGRELYSDCTTTDALEGTESDDRDWKRPNGLYAHEREVCVVSVACGLCAHERVWGGFLVSSLLACARKSGRCVCCVVSCQQAVDCIANFSTARHSDQRWHHSACEVSYSEFHFQYAASIFSFFESRVFCMTREVWRKLLSTWLYSPATHEKTDQCSQQRVRRLICRLHNA